MNMYSLMKDIATEVNSGLFEGGAGSGNYGHKGRPGHRGGSLPGGGQKVSAHVAKRVYSREMALSVKAKGITNASGAMAYMKQKYPGQPEDRYQRALKKAGISGGVVATSTTPRVESSLSIAKKLEKNGLSNVRPLGGGFSPTFVVDVDADGKAVAKTLDNRALKEYACYELDKMMGLGVVPPVKLRDIDVGRGKGSEKCSLMYFVPGKTGMQQALDGGQFRLHDMMKITAFDWVTNNQDRHPGNYIVDKTGRAWAIDHALAFTNYRQVLSTVYPMVEGKLIPKDIKVAVKRMVDNRKSLEGSLAKDVGNAKWAKEAFNRAESFLKLDKFPPEKFTFRKVWSDRFKFDPNKIKQLVTEAIMKKPEKVVFYQYDFRKGLDAAVGSIMWNGKKMVSIGKIPEQVLVELTTAGILDYAGRKDKLLFPKDGIRFLEMLKHRYDNPYLRASDVMKG